VSGVRTPTVRTLALVSTVLVALTAPALADDDDVDDDDEEVTPMPRTSVGFGFQGHGSRIGGRSEAGFGPTLELALGRGRWQYVAEASVATSGMDEWTTPALESEINGRLLRGSLGLRWIARQFTPAPAGAIELLLLAGLGAQRFDFDDGRLIRPEVALGFGVQIRKFENPRLAFRLDARAVFTPNNRESALVSCRGNCMAESGASTGFLTGMTIAW
jgi:hypothetical protein